MARSPKIVLPSSSPFAERKRESDLLSKLYKSVELAASLDEEKDYLCQRAPNAIEWAVRKEFCNQPTLYKFWGAYKLIRDFFELRCPNCNDDVPYEPWGLSQAALESEVLLVWSAKDEDDACPKCHTVRSEFIDEGFFHGYRVLAAEIGQRAGKSTTLALVGTYIEHVLLTVAHTFPDGLPGYFGTAKGEPFDMSFVASNEDQSKDTIWAKYRGHRSNSPWFQRYVPWVKLQEKAQDTPDGMRKWEYVENDKSIRNELIGLNINSLNSNSHGQRGRTRIFSAIDEISHMHQTDGGGSAQEVYRAMNNSCQTVRIAAERFGLIGWMGMIASISSPVSVDDYGMQLLQIAAHDPQMYTLHSSTWDFNPTITRATLEPEFKKDPIGAMRDFGARPPLAASPLIDRPKEFVSSAVEPELRPTAIISSYSFKDDLGRSYVGARLDHADLMLRAPPRFIAVDAGKNFDAFAVACAHGEMNDDGNIETVYDWVVRLITVEKNQEVYFESIYNLLDEMRQYCQISRVEFDHWQSTHIIQKIRTELGLYAEPERGRDEDFIRFMRDAYTGLVRLLPELPADATLDPAQKSAQGAAIYELLKLERDPKTDKIFNSRKGLRKGFDSDDTARVIVNVHRLVQDQGFTERQDDTGRQARKKRSQVALAEWSAQSRGQIFKPSRGTRGW